jgi:hypothetical protein
MQPTWPKSRSPRTASPETMAEGGGPVDSESLAAGAAAASRACWVGFTRQPAGSPANKRRLTRPAAGPAHPRLNRTWAHSSA